MILTFQTSFPSVDEEERYADIDVPATRRVDDVWFWQILLSVAF